MERRRSPIAENTSITGDNMYEAVDPDVDVDDDNADPTWMLSGPDRSRFDITGGLLTFMTDFTPNYEMPADDNMDNTYEVMVVATVGGMSGTRDVKVMVTDVEEAGTVTLNRTQPRVGVSVTATLTDPDGSISGLTWQWYNDAIDTNNLEDNAIEGAMSNTYTPVADDVTSNVILMARAMYTDGQGPMKFAVGTAANMVAEDTRNKPPAFVDQDTETDGDQSESTERNVEENTKALAGSDDDDAATDDAPADNVGSPVMAEDPDPNTDPLIYTLSGDDAGAFRVRDNGQIEVAAGTELDYETTRTYAVTLTAEDSFGASDTIMVTIMVTDRGRSAGDHARRPGDIGHEQRLLRGERHGRSGDLHGDGPRRGHGLLVTVGRRHARLLPQ